MNKSTFFTHNAVLVIVLGLICIIWMNFHTNLFYTTDLYSDAHIAQLMSEEHTLFPKTWVFGNQYYTIATPTLCALIMLVSGTNSVTAMSIASTIMCIVLLLATLYMLRGANLSFNDCLKGIAVFLSFAVLDYFNRMTLLGPQIVFTKASYYSCYIIVAFLTVGFYLRIRSRQFCKTDILPAVLLCILHFLCGMQSLRELLIVNIPLLLLLLIQMISSHNRRGLLLLALLACIEVLGLLYIRLLAIPSVSIIVANTDYWVQIKETIRAIIAVTGLYFIKYLLNGEIQYIIPVFLSIIVLINNILSIRQILREKDFEGLNGVIVFHLLSLFCVLGCCIIPFVKPNPHYFFMYYGLSVCCSVSLFSKKNKSNLVLNKTLRNYAFIIVALFSFLWNYTPYIRIYRHNIKQLSSFTQQLVDEGIRTVLVFYQDAPIFAATSEDRITAGIYRFDSEGNSMITHIPYLYDSSIYERISDKNTLLCLTDKSIDMMPSLSKETILPSLKKYSEIEINQVNYYLYYIDPRIIDLYSVPSTNQ